MKAKPEQYRFVEDYEINGTKIKAGVALKGPFVIEDGKLTVEWSSFLKGIPLSILEKCTPTTHKRTRKKKTKETISKTKKNSSESARISDKKI